MTRSEQDTREGLYTITLAARRLRMSYNRCYNRALSGQFGEVTEHNGRLYVSADAVTRYAEAHPQVVAV
ncbi:MAG: hypothetical protein E2O47_06335 [Gemmatimonadetes bacterium]|nr:MAG: hypothetical protein E2O47_06335 [Gemmatimonadota bacterium]